MESESTKRRYKLLAEYIKGRDPSIFISFVKNLWPWQIIKILSPRAVLYALFKKNELSSYEIHQRKLPFELKEELTGRRKPLDKNKQILEVVPAPVITLNFIEIINDKDVRLKNAMLRSWLNDFVNWCASNDDNKLPIEKKIINYAVSLEKIVDKKVSSKEVENYCNRILNCANLEKILDDFEKDSSESQIIILKLRKFIKEGKRCHLIINKDIPDYTLALLSKEININASTFYHEIEYQKLIHLFSPPTNSGLIYVKDLVRCLRKTLKDPLLLISDFEENLGGKRIRIFLPKKLLSIVQKVTNYKRKH